MQHRMGHGARSSNARRCLAAALVVLLAGCRSDLYSQLPEEDANEMLDALYAAGIEASKEPAGEKLFNVQVASDQLQPALRAVRERGLPRQRFTDLGTLFKKEGLVSTPSEERVRFIYGISQELSKTLTSIDGVLSARVHPVIPANDPMADKIKPSSASVFVKHDPHANVQALAPAIKNLVMRGIEGLQVDNITLTFVAADPPQRKPVMTARSPAWLGWAVGGAGAAWLLAVAALGFVIWRYRQLAMAMALALQVRDGNDVAGNDRSRMPWWRELWRGSAAADLAALPPARALLQPPSRTERFPGPTVVAGTAKPVPAQSAGSTR